MEKTLVGAQAQKRAMRKSGIFLHEKTDIRSGKYKLDSFKEAMEFCQKHNLIIHERKWDKACFMDLVTRKKYTLPLNYDLIWITL